MPQNIMDVEFKLFGAFTLKQFMNLAINVIIALFVYSFPLPDVIKWPIMLLFVALGLALALVTVNGMPFSNWLTNFITALTTSQRRVWKKSPKRPEVLKGNYKPKGKYTTHLISRSKKANVSEMPLLGDEAKIAADQSDKEEQNRFKTIEMHLQQNYDKKELEKAKTQPILNPEEETNANQAPPVINTKTQGLAMNNALNDPNVSTIQTGESLAGVIRTTKKPEIKKDKNYYRNLIKKEKEKDTKINSAENLPEIANEPSSVETSDPQIKTGENITTPEPPPVKESSTIPVSNNNEVALLKKQIEDLQTKVNAMQASPQDTQKEEAELKTQISSISSTLKTPGKTHPKTTSPQQAGVTEIETNAKEEEIEESKQSAPNLLSGYVIDLTGKGILGVSIEIKDKQYFPVRKVLTDNNGYFSFKTPLPNGDYILDFEKYGRIFRDYNIHLNGQVLPIYRFKELPKKK